jgi:H+/Cl- antiporter ClcA
MTTVVVPAHMGDLHAYEQLLVWLLAFGPFVVLFVVVYVVRRRELAEGEEETSEAEEPVSGRAS